jgi:hypothetical protein
MQSDLTCKRANEPLRLLDHDLTVGMIVVRYGVLYKSTQADGGMI